MSEQETQLEYIKKCRQLLTDKMQSSGKILKYIVTTFGCQMNARDSEKLSGILKESGFIETDKEEEADFIIFNTCTVRDNANQRVYGRLGVLKKYKKNNPDLKIAICGCMMQEPTAVEYIKKHYKHVDLIFGTHNIYKFAELLYRSYTTEGLLIDIWDKTDEIVEQLPTDRKYPYKSGVNIMFGCNNFCSYCIVPYVRGRERSRRPSEIISEIKSLVADGVIEVMLLGQNVNSYGKDFIKAGDEEAVSFPELLKLIENIDGLKRIRFMTSHPKDLSDELIDVMANSRKICHHLHLPLQSGSNRILKEMNRHYTKEQYIELALKIRKRIPDIAITTDIIIGFPGETPADVDETIDVINQVAYDGAFTFIYSKRSGTPAAVMENQVSKEDAQIQFDRVLSTVQETAKKRCNLLTGSTVEVLTEGEDEQEEGFMTGRLSNNSCVHFKGDKSLTGKIVTVKLKECKGFYYIGELTS